ncbi:hypothetical protein LPJ77_006092, partial [Coemansia sp. RSA 2523]
MRESTSLNLISQNLRGIGPGGRVDPNADDVRDARIASARYTATTLEDSFAQSDPTPAETAAAWQAAAPPPAQNGIPEDFLDKGRFRLSGAQRFKLSQLRTALRRGERPSDQAVDVAFLQEFTTQNNPRHLMQIRADEYQYFCSRPVPVPQPNGPPTAPNSDTVIAVHSRLGKARFEAAASCPRAVFVTLPDVGILLVNIHGPFLDKHEWHGDMVDTIMLYVEAGWLPIIGGDFNIAPHPTDRITSDRRGEMLEQGIIASYEAALNVRDACAFQHPLPRNPSTTGPQALDRSMFFTFKKMDNELGIYTYRSRVDMFLVPRQLLARTGTLYSAIDRGSFSDHKELSLHLALTPRATYFARGSYRLPFDFMANEKHRRRVDDILGEYDFNTTEPFEDYKRLLDRIKTYAREENQKLQKSLSERIEGIRRQHAKLGNSHDGWVRHKAQLDDLEAQAAMLTEMAATDVQLRAASVWLKQGDRDAFWMSMRTKRQLHPRTRTAITALYQQLPGDDTAELGIATT